MLATDLITAETLAEFTPEQLLRALASAALDRAGQQEGYGFHATGAYWRDVARATLDTVEALPSF